MARNKPRPITYGMAIGLTFGLLVLLALQILWIAVLVGVVSGLVIGIGLLVNYRRVKGRKGLKR